MKSLLANFLAYANAFAIIHLFNKKKWFHYTTSFTNLIQQNIHLSVRSFNCGGMVLFCDFILDFNQP